MKILYILMWIPFVNLLVAVESILSLFKHDPVHMFRNEIFSKILGSFVVMQFIVFIFFLLVDFNILLSIVFGLVSYATIVIISGLRIGKYYKGQEKIKNQLKMIKLLNKNNKFKRSKKLYKRRR